MNIYAVGEKVYVKEFGNGQVELSVKKASKSDEMGVHVGEREHFACSVKSLGYTAFFYR